MLEDCEGEKGDGHIIILVEYFSGTWQFLDIFLEILDSMRLEWTYFS